jgi:hypothetical protein
VIGKGEKVSWLSCPIRAAKFRTQLQQDGGQVSVDQTTTSINWVPSTTYQRPRTVPKTERCTVGLLSATSENVKPANVLTQVLEARRVNRQTASPGGLNGTYAVPGGLNSEAYEILRENAQMVVKFQNNAGRLSLVLQPNGILIGGVSVEVIGRRAIQGNGGVDYLSPNAR